MSQLVRIRQDKQARNSVTYDDTKSSGAAMETTPENLEEDLNNLRSQLRRIIDPAGNWFDAPVIDLQTLGDDSLRRYRQPLVGIIDGVTTDFTLGIGIFYKHGGYKNEEVYLNGVLQDEGVSCDYEAVESGGVGTGYDTIRFALAPRVGDTLAINYTPK